VASNETTARRDSIALARWSSTYRRYVHLPLRLVPSDGRRREPVHGALPPSRRIDRITLPTCCQDTDTAHNARKKHQIPGSEIDG
jgi:hypothetical protein